MTSSLLFFNDISFIWNNVNDLFSLAELVERNTVQQSGSSAAEPTIYKRCDYGSDGKTDPVLAVRPHATRPRSHQRLHPPKNTHRAPREDGEAHGARMQAISLVVNMGVLRADTRLRKIYHRLPSSFTA